MRSMVTLHYDWNTQQTLIQRAQNPDDHQAWEDFVLFYQSFVKMVVRKSNISLDEEDDLVQSILLKVWKGLPNYEYRKENAKFRTWLSTIIRNTSITYFKKNEKELDKKNSMLQNIEKVSESAIESIIDAEWNEYVASLAMDKVKEKFEGQAIEVFRLSLEEKNAREISELLNIKEDTVYSLRSRVKRRLKQEISALRELIEVK
ncbi:MAG: sigma-70 family RNA polymerase sigma factor [Lentisphaeraceae bacterium]|nr:sigma-70 family RNA polymerase sigma factor [Lentisphaeraceae bacterium]